MKSLATPLLAASVLGFPTALHAAGTTEPKLLIIGIDGCRPDALQAADTPNLDSLIAAGSVSYEAQTGEVTSSGPSWSSMLTAVWADKHGVTDNSFAGANFDDYPHFFTRLKSIQPAAFTASIVHWSPINTEIVSDADLVLSGLSDAQVSAEAAQLLSAGDPDAVFLHFDDVDGAGHGCCYDPENADYIAAIETVDALVGPILDAIVNRPTYDAETWLILASTDHGGTGTGHGLNIPEHRTIFVIVSGPTACAGTIVPAPGIVDVAATGLAHFGAIDPAWDWDGVAVGLTNCVTGTCVSGLVAQPDHAAGTVALGWDAAQDIDADGYALRRNGALIATLDLTETSYLDTPDLGMPIGHVSLSYELATFGGTEGGLCPPVTAGVVLSTGDVRLADDFEAYADDAALVAGGWRIVDVNAPLEDSSFTLSNPGGRGNPPDLRGEATPGRFLISDSDWGGAQTPNPTGSGMSHDVWSPSFDCTAMDAVWLHLDCAALLNNNGKAVFDIDVTIDDTQSWTNVWRRVAPARTEAPPVVTTANADGFYGRLDVDLSDPAVGQPNVRFRVRHFEPNWDWWIAFDNVIVDDLDLTAGGPVVLLNTQDFSTGIPGGWSVQGLNAGDDTWTTNDPCARSIEAAGAPFPYQDGRAVHRLGTAFAILDSACDPDPAEDEVLVSPVIDCSDSAWVFLHYRSEIVTAGAATEEVLLSVDGGSTFLGEPLFSYAGGGLTLGEDPAYAQRVLAVPAAAGQPSVAFGFRYQSGGGQWWWAVDDVGVTAFAAQPCPWDLDDDGDVGVSDFLLLLAVWGQAGVPADFDGGGVGVSDFLILLANWGSCPLGPLDPACGLPATMRADLPP